MTFVKSVLANVLRASSCRDLVNSHLRACEGGKLVRGMKHVDIEIRLTTDVRSRNDER